MCKKKNNNRATNCSDMLVANETSIYVATVAFYKANVKVFIEQKKIFVLLSPKLVLLET